MMMIMMLRSLLPVILGAVLVSAAAADERVDRLPEEYKTWLEQDVVYIITERERDVFLSLETLDERNRFIEAFWRKRDSNRTTPENEYRVEHYRRIEYANTYLGRETYREGWRTDRGRYYILLGEPREIQRYDGYGKIVSTHLWFYQGDPLMGVPSFFYLLFFKRNDFGEFRLYSPVVDGPQSLLTQQTGQDNIAAVTILDEISPELATASLSYDTGEPPDLIGGRASVGSDAMIARIEESPKRAIRTDYADAALRYGNRVSADYTFNYVPSRSQFSVLVDPSGTAIVLYSIEIDPENFSTESDEEQTKFYTTLDLTIEARTPEGVLVVGNDKEVYLELSPSQMRGVQSKPFAYQDQFPLVPGDYMVSVILRNRVLRQYAVAEAELSIPNFSASTPQLADIILAYDTSVVDGDAADGFIRTYQLGNERIEPATGSVFVIDDTVHVVTQAFGASSEHRVTFELLSGDEVLQTITSSVGPNGIVIDVMKLANMVGGTYEIRARLLSPPGETPETLSERSAPITISPRSFATRPGFVYRRGFDSRLPGLLSAMRGEQLSNLGRFEEARLALEEAIAANPGYVPARVMLATIYLRAGDADQTLELLAPLEEVLPNEYDVISGIGLGRYLKGEYQNAVDYLERARTLRPPPPLLLNALADSYERLGNIDKAREIYERSLFLDSDQGAVRERLATLGASGVKN